VAEEGKEAEFGQQDMDSWCGAESGNPLTGPRIYSVVGLLIGLLGYFGSGLFEWMTSSEEHFRTRYSALGYVSLIFLVLSARHVAGMVGTVLTCCCKRQGTCPCSGRQASSNLAMLVIGVALYSANSRDSFPCDLSGYSYASAPPANHDPCGARPEQEFASRSLGVYYAPVTARLSLVTSLGTVRGSGSYTPAYACNATVSVARAPALAVSFNKFLASGALLSLSPPALCPGAATAPQLPPALQAESGYSEGSVLHAWLGFRAPTAVDAGDARVTLQLLAGAAGAPYLPRPPLRWEENRYPPRQAGASSGSASSIPLGTGGRFALSEAGDSNPFRLAPDTAASTCAGSGGHCKGNWSLSDVRDLDGTGLQVSLGSFGGEAWVWRVEASSRVEIAYAGLDMCAEKEDLG
jgi:hypothetical protein